MADLVALRLRDHPRGTLASLHGKVEGWDDNENHQLDNVNRDITALAVLPYEFDLGHFINRATTDLLREA